MRRTRYYLLLSITFLCSPAATGQDALFSQLHNARNLLNPALLSLQNHALELDLNFREQGRSVSQGEAIRTFQVLANFTEQSFKVDRLSYGLAILSDRGGRGHVGESIAHANFSYLKKLTGRYSKIGEHYIGIGTAFGAGQKSVDSGNFWFGNQFNEQYNFIEEGKDPKEDLLFADMSARSAILFNVNAGVVWYANLREAWSMNAGVSMFHLNRANISLIDGQVENQKFRYVLHLGFVNENSDLISLQPKIQFVRHGVSSFFILGSEVGMNNGDRNEFDLKVGLFARSISTVDNLAMDAVLITLNVKYNQFIFGLGYDLTVSALSRYNNGFGSWEFRLGYAFKGRSKQNGDGQSNHYRF